MSELPVPEVSRLDLLLRRGALVTAIAGSLSMGAAPYLNLPKRVKALEDLDLQQNLAVVRAQNDWLVHEFAKRWRVQPPDFSRFEPQSSRRDDARRD